VVRTAFDLLLQPFIAVGEWCTFFVSVLLPTIRAYANPRDVVRYLYGVVLGALPLAMVLGVTLGAVIWMQTRGLLERTAGAAELLPTVLAVAVVLELSPVGAGLIVAARTGAGLGAEVASMRVTEQTDALELLGLSPIRKLVAPRIAACIVAVPILHILTATTALLSGFAAESIVGGTNWLRYQELIFAELHFADVVAALLKTFAFGGLIGIAGCRIGLTAPGGSAGVGRAATSAVVVASLFVLAADVFAVAVFRIL